MGPTASAETLLLRDTNVARSAGPLHEVIEATVAPPPHLLHSTSGNPQQRCTPQGEMTAVGQPWFRSLVEGSMARHHTLGAHGQTGLRDFSPESTALRDFPMPSHAAPDFSPQRSPVGSFRHYLSSDSGYILQEAQRKKQELDRSMAAQLGAIEASHQKAVDDICRSGEYQLQLVQAQIGRHKEQHQASLRHQLELQVCEIAQKAELQKKHLGQEACRLVRDKLDQQRAAIFNSATHKADEVWRQQQQRLWEQGQEAQREIGAQAQRQSADAEREAREAMERVYMSPEDHVAAQQMLTGSAMQAVPTIWREQACSACSSHPSALPCLYRA